MVEHLNAKRPQSQKLTHAIHIASKLIDRYQDFDALVVDDSGADVSMGEFVAKYGRPPSKARVDGCTIPIHGIEAILAVARLVADTDCLGGGLENAGFTVRRNAIGKPLSVHAAKIDAGYSCNFRGKDNIYTESFSPFYTGRKMRDQRDIQFGNNQTFEIEFKKLLPAQEEVFMQTFTHGLQLLNKKFMTTLIWRDNLFKAANVCVSRLQVDQAVKEWSVYLSHLKKTYRYFL